jgi:type IV secretory pathway TrbF-like protein
MYLDPGFGSMFIQIVVAIIAAGGAILFSMRKKIRGWLTKGKAGDASAAAKAGGTDPRPNASNVSAGVGRGVDAAAKMDADAGAKSSVGIAANVGADGADSDVVDMLPDDK